MVDDLMVREKQAVEGYKDPAAVAAAETAKARIQAAYIMAMNKPRDTETSRVRILKSCERHQLAERAEYKKPVGGGFVKGPSVRLAELAIREWGNIMTDTQVLYEDVNVRRIRVTVTDLETNSSFGKEIQVHKTVERKKAGADREIIDERLNTKGEKVFVVRATEDELHNKEAAMISKVMRNEGLRLIPSDIIDEALEIAANTLTQRDQEDPDAAKKRVVDGFATIGVMPKDLEKHLGVPVAQINPSDLQDLRAIFGAIKDGETTWREFIAGEEPDKIAEPKATKPVTEEEPAATVEPKKKPGRPRGSTTKEETPKVEPLAEPTEKTEGPTEPDMFDESDEIKAKIKELGEAMEMTPEEIQADLDKAKTFEGLTVLRVRYVKAYNEKLNK